MAGPSDKWRDKPKAAHGQTFQIDYGRDRSDELDISASKEYPTEGSAESLKYTLENGKVPQD